MPSAAVRLALVHHLNQYLVTDGYPDRQGVSEIAEGYAAALRLHAMYRVPTSLHLSGTLVEALAWHQPRLLREIRAMRDEGLVSVVGGTYSENVMTVFSPDFNRRQLDELLWLYELHLGCPAPDVQICWVPERVWDTGKLAAVLTDPGLANGGYRFVLLDDRVMYPVGSRYEHSERARFDGPGPAARVDPPAPQPAVCTIAGAAGLRAVPISGALRHCVPPWRAGAWEHLNQLVDGARRQGGVLLTFADDFERTIGVGGWDPLGMRNYDMFLRWLSHHDDIEVVELPSALQGEPEPAEVEVEAGTFFELARQWGAGEDYSGWWGSQQWSRSRRHLAAAEQAVAGMPTGGPSEYLTRLAHKHLLASAYETAWHDEVAGQRIPAAWATAVAGHARACLPIARAADWFSRADRRPMAEVVDVDIDGEDEVLLGNEDLFAVLAPRHGGRLVYLFHRAEQGAVMVVGNPSDDWNLQSSLNRYMDCPPNHAGALADCGFEHDHFEVAELTVQPTLARVVLEDTTGGSALQGLRKTFLLPTAGATVVRYDLPPGAAGLSVEACLSPDYLTLLRRGRVALEEFSGALFRGARGGLGSVWVATLPGERVGWGAPARPEAGHGVNVRLRAEQRRFHVVVGAGARVQPVSDVGLRRDLLGGVGPGGTSPTGARTKAVP